MLAPSTTNVQSELRSYGVPPGCVRSFVDGAAPELLNYLDLIAPRGSLGTNEIRPDAVAEVQGRPVVFFVKEDHLANPASQHQRYGHLCRSLASRGDQAYLARIRPGELLVEPVRLAGRTDIWREYKKGTAEAATFFSRLSHGTLDGVAPPDDSGLVFREMLGLVEHVAEQLSVGLDRGDVLSLIGRALFFRFLSDRRVVTDLDVRKIAPGARDLRSCFADAASAHLTCRWLDATFNDDFLPLSGDGPDFFTRVGQVTPSAFWHLTAILRGWEPAGPDAYQTKLFDWTLFDFAHVPVGLLSQVYEAFCWKWDRQTAQETSVHYTPRNIAATLVDEAFEGMPNADTSRVLDCAAGAGVFLVLAFRRLYRERWAVTGERPGTQAIREILDGQLAGFDVSDSALRLCALSLYLTAIELDPLPIPPEKLHFQSLKGSVLFNHDERPGPGPGRGPTIGSLGQHVSRVFDGKFDLVLSNPPWTSMPERFNQELTDISRGVIERLGDRELAKAYRNPDNEPDLPFLWKATEWCKPGGRIAMALPARILLKQAEIPRFAREALFRKLEVTGIINGSNLSDTKVWPDMLQPFMLFFARNARPAEGHSVSFISLTYDRSSGVGNELRIDAKSAVPLNVAAMSAEPWLWKAAAIGSELDIPVIRAIRSASATSLLTYWEDVLRLETGKGYQIAAKQKQLSARHLHRLPDIGNGRQFTFDVDTSGLHNFARETACFPRREAIYLAPLLLVRESPRADRTLGRGLVSFRDIAYSESFCGYSAKGHPDGETLVRFLHLFIHSSIWIYYALLTSPKFGAERRRFYKEDLDDCPVVPLESLSDGQRDLVRELSTQLVAGDDVFDKIDAFFGKLYGLDDIDEEVIRDTLATCLPFKAHRDRSANPPSQIERDAFGRRLAELLEPFFRVLGKQVEVALWRSDKLLRQVPFGVVSIAERGQTQLPDERLFDGLLFDMADEVGASRIVQWTGTSLVVAVVDQSRYWTPTRARLLAADIIRTHFGGFEGD